MVLYISQPSEKRRIEEEIVLEIINEDYELQRGKERLLGYAGCD